jgi:hypothetical protein
MNIIFDTENIEAIKNNNIVLELDTFYFTKLDKTTTAYCVIDNVKLTDIEKIDQHQRLHAELISAYKNKDFTLCQDLLEHLIGVFDGEVDSFYNELIKRIDSIKTTNLPDGWTATIIKSDQ